MIKSLLILVALAVGFGVGVYWGVHHPVEAQKLATAEERQFVEKQKVLLEKVKRKFDELANSQPAGGTTGSGAGRSGFVGTTSGAARKDPEIEDLKRESDRQLQEANKLLQRGK
jgi:hypothetical protein